MLAFGLAATALAGCGGGGSGAASTQDVVQTLLTSSDPAKRAEAARTLAANPNPAVVRRVRRAARGASGRTAVTLLRGRLVGAYKRSPGRPARRAAAVRALAAFDDAAAARTIVTAIARDRSPIVRSASVAALGGMRAGRDAAPALVVAHDQGGPGLAQVEQALASIGVPAVRILLPRLSDDEWPRAVVGKVGRPTLPLLRAQLRRARFEARVDASYGIVAVAQRVRAARPDLARVVSSMMQVLGGTNDTQRFTAIQVLAAAGRPAVDTIVPILRRSYLSLSTIEKKQWEWGVQLLVETTKANPPATRHLVRALGGKDYDLIADLHQFYIELGRPGSEAALIAALNAAGDATMALDFLNSGNKKLDRGARAWAESHGYTITEKPGPGAPQTWGNIKNAP